MTIDIMSPSSHHRTSLHAVILMFGEVDLPVMLIMDPSLASLVQHSPFQFHALAYTGHLSAQAALSFRSRAVYVARDDHYLTRSKFNSLLAEMITPQTTNIHTSIYIISVMYFIMGASVRELA